MFTLILRRFVTIVIVRGGMNSRTIRPYPTLVADSAWQREERLLRKKGPQAIGKSRGDWMTKIHSRS